MQDEGDEGKNNDAKEKEEEIEKNSICLFTVMLVVDCNIEDTNTTD